MNSRNELLAKSLSKTGWSLGELARRVRTQAARGGHSHIATDASSVRRWLQGQQPRWPVPGLLADVLSSQLGYRVNPGDLGFEAADEVDAALTYNPSYAATVEVVSDLGKADLNRRSFLVGSSFVAAASAAPSRNWLLATVDPTATRAPSQVSTSDVQEIADSFAVFQRVDIFQGGGAGRAALATYLTQSALPLLRLAAREPVRLALAGVLAQQTYLLGWMAYDDGEHGTAQRYLIQALRLAEESSDALLGAHILAGMADQATLLGHPHEGRRLAQAGRAGIARRSDATACLADLWALEARALAKLGERTAAIQAVIASDQASEKVRPDNEPEWARFIDEAYLNGEHAHTFLDIRDSTEAHNRAHRSITDARTQGRARRGALSHTALALAHLQRHDLEAAHAIGCQAAALTRSVASTRCTQAITTIHHTMASIAPNNPLVTDFAQHARTTLPRQ